MTVTPLRRAFVALALLAWLLAAAPVFAHVELQATFPEAGGTTQEPPREVAARFTGPVAGNSTIEVIGPDGASVATGGIDPQDPTRLVAPFPANATPGTYEARWQVFSEEDGHLERGRFRFTVAAPTPPPPTPTPSARPSAVPSPSSVPSPTAAPTEVPVPSPAVGTTPPPASGSDVLLPIVAALVVLGVLGVGLLRRRGGRGA